MENYTIQSGTYDFLLVFDSNHRPISYRFRDKRRYPSKSTRKSTIFPNSHVFNATAEVVPRGIVYRRRGLKKLEWWGFQMVEKNLQIGLAVLIQYRRVTDTQPASQPATHSRHVAVASTTLTASRR